MDRSGYCHSPTWTRTVDAEPTEYVGEVIRGLGGAAESGAVDAPAPGSDPLASVPVRSEKAPALQLLVEVWDELPDSVKNQLLKLADDAVTRVR